jgi:mevalonate kinase
MFLYLDKDGDKIVLPVDDIKETVTALQCFGFYLSNTPIQIFVQTQDLKKLTKASSKLEDRSAKICGCGDCGLIIADKLSQLESTIHILGQRIVVLLEDLGK